jgi:hypothetical protein
MKNYEVDGSVPRERRRDNARPIDPSMLLLWERIDSLCASLDYAIQALVGESRGFTVMIHPRSRDCATLSVTNQTENIEHVREWVSRMEAAQEAPEEGRASDGLTTASYRTRIKYLQICKAHLAEREADTYQSYVQRMPDGLPLFSEDEWTKLHEQQLHGFRENIRLNRVRKRSE